MGKRIQAAQAADPQNHDAEPGCHPPPHRRPPGRKPGPAPQSEAFGRHLRQLVRHCFPLLNAWFDGLPDRRRQDLCTYEARHLWWQALLTFLLRGGSRNAFDADRNTGRMPNANWLRSTNCHLCHCLTSTEPFAPLPRLS